MNSDPLDVALRHINETKDLLDTLIKSSESFDYQHAKSALKELQRKSRDLAKTRAAIELRRCHTGTLPENVVRVPFRSVSGPPR